MSGTGYLQDCRVVDLSMGWAGPLATRNLADLGADVIKVESCVYFDWFRGWEANQSWIDNNGAEKHPAFNSMNRNKRAVTLDLATEKGRDLLLRLVSTSDAVVENFPSSVLPKLNLGYEVFQEVKSDIVMVSMPGFGSTGPWRNYRAYGSTTEQAAGLPHLSGHPEWPPTMVHIALGDAIAGLNGTAALLIALRHRKRTGEGQFVDLSHSECLLPLGAHGISEQALTGTAPPRLGNRSRYHAPHGSYPCLEGRWIVIQVETEKQWEAMRDLVGRPLDSFGSLQDRLARNAELDAVVSDWTSTLSAATAMAELQAVGVPAGVVNRSQDLRVDPHLDARNFWELIPRPYVGELPYSATAYRVDGKPMEVRSPSPTLGQHNREVLGGILGVDDSEIADLVREGVIGTKPQLPRRNIK